MNSNHNQNETFAIVPNGIITSRRLSASKKVVIAHLLAKYQIRLADGKPYTFSVAGIMDGTGLEKRTVERIVSYFQTCGILKHYGVIKNEYHAGRPTNLYLFQNEGLNDPKIINVKNAPNIIPNEINDLTDIEACPKPELTSELTSKRHNRSKIIEVKKEENTCLNTLSISTGSLENLADVWERTLREVDSGSLGLIGNTSSCSGSLGVINNKGATCSAVAPHTSTVPDSNFNEDNYNGLGSPSMVPGSLVHAHNETVPVLGYPSMVPVPAVNGEDCLRVNHSADVSRDCPAGVDHSARVNDPVLGSVANADDFAQWAETAGRAIEATIYRQNESKRPGEAPGAFERPFSLPLGDCFDHYRL
jgi:hypothetical protein